MTNGEYIHERVIIKNNLSLCSSILTLSIYVGYNENSIFCITTHSPLDIDYFSSKIEYRQLMFPTLFSCLSKFRGRDFISHLARDDTTDDNNN